MKISSVLLQAALVVALAISSSYATLEVDNQHSKPDFASSSSSSSSLSGSFDGSHDSHHHHRGDYFRDGSGSGLVDYGSDDGSHGSGFPCDRLFGSYSGSHDSSSGPSSRPYKPYFRGDVGDDYDFGYDDDDSDDSFDGSGGSNSVRCRHFRYKFGSGSGSEGSRGFYEDAGEHEDNDDESSESSDSPRGHHHHHIYGSKTGSGSEDTHRFRGFRSN